ncbi:MAG: alpha/beta-hydrolase family protein [Oleispira sp.]|nr:alpha/beta-hydrolase family protein [Oleispira sp.]
MKYLKYCLNKYHHSLSYTGLIIAVVFFSISLMPSLLPRPYVLQGLLSGLTLTVGYGIGICLRFIWRYLEMPYLTGRIKSYFQYTVTILSLLLFSYAIYYSSSWQDEVRLLMGLAPAKESLHFKMIAIALLLAFFLLFISRTIFNGFDKVRSNINRIIPKRISNLLGLILVVFTVFVFTNNFIISKVVASLDEVYSFADENSDKGISKPINQNSTGSAGSFIKWKSIGRTGQNFVAAGPNYEDLSAFFNQHTLNPLRVYAGLRSGDSVQERADLALQELIRIKGFSRSKLVIATPTGTGWLDPSAMDPFEYLHKGDTAIVSMQYSYLPSWLTLLVNPAGAKESALVLYNTIHQYWSKLPRDTRPDLYIFGLSLGSLAAETSMNVATMMSNPIQGGLLVGPPFPSTLAPILIKQRNVNSPQWLPTIHDSSLVRFSAQKNYVKNEDWQWGPMRFVYIQYASDPMVFFSLDLFRKEPDWMMGARGHDVSPDFKWYPVITFLQVLFDLPMADRMPRGNSHNYSASSYIDGWLEVTQPENLSLDEENKIRHHFRHE